MVLLLISILVTGNSLYSDSIDALSDVEKTALEKAYQYSDNTPKNDQLIANNMSLYMQTIFGLSQLTSELAHISDESKIYSDINRLDRISIELTKMLDDKNINFYFKPVGQLSKLQAYYQKTLFKFHVISPYLPQLLHEEEKQTSYYINYIQRISAQIQTNIQEMVAVKQQLNMTNQSPLPFSPQTPEQLSFALENQLNSSIINMINASDGQSSSDMPFADISTPPNANMFNQNSLQGMPNVSTPNGSPLQMMNYIPSF
tara:strand:- start:286 stop:1062 length:777 start_codon:yes stop_codon:yes gene_type:complete